MKKQFVLWLTLFIPLLSFADEWQDPETKVNYTYTPGNTNATVKAGGYNWSDNAYTAGSPLVSGDVQIRSEFIIDTTTYIVSSIGYSAFANCNGLSSIRIPSGLKTIGNNAFNGCDNLSAIHIPESLAKIEDSAFEGCNNLSAVYIKDLAAWCNITFTSSGWSNPVISNPLNYAHHLYLNGEEMIDLHIPEGVTTIKSYAFCGGSSIKSIHVPEGVKTIKGGAFQACSSLNSIYLPKSLTICEAAFDGCDNLSSVHIEDIAAWCEIFWGSSDLSYYYGNGSEYANPLTKAHHLFINGEEVKDVVIPDGVKRVRDYTFAGGNYFSSISIPASLNSTGVGAFKNCTGLTAVYITDLEAWCNIAFGNSNFSDSDMNPLINAHHLYLDGMEVIDLTIPETITEIKQMAFYGCSGLVNLTIGENIKTIRRSAFAGCDGLKSLHIPKSVISIESSAFSGCGSLLSIAIDEENEIYDSRDDCNAIINKNSNVLMLGCSNTVIPNSVNKIGDSAFSGCKGLTSIVFPSNITGLGYGAFRGCSNLNVITSYIEEPFAIISPGYNGPFEWDTFSSARLYVPEASLSKYKNAEVWNYFHDIRAISNNDYSDTNTGVRYSFDDTNMTAYVTENQSKDLSGEIEILSTITIGGKTYQVTTISGYAFFGCENISSLIIPEGITSIEKYAFAGCKGLTSITIPESVTNIQNNTIFSDCSNLTSVTILCPTVGTWFSGNKTIENVKIGNTVKTIENSAFSNCSNLESVIIDDGIAAIGSYTFGWCKKLIEVKLPQSLTNVGPNAFWYCTALPEIALPEGLVSIGSSAFVGCHALTEITIPENVSSIGEWAFHGCENISKVTSFIKEPFSVNYTAFAFPDTNSASSSYHPTAILYVPIGSVDKYKNTEGWKIFTTISAISDHIYADDNGITYELYNDNTTAYVGTNQSKELSGNITVKQQISYEGKNYNVIGISDYAFRGCDNLTSIILPNGVTVLGAHAFSGCSKLETMNIPSGIVSIGESSFEGCVKMLSVSIPNSVTTIGTNAFKGCEALEKVITPNIDSWCHIDFKMDSWYDWIPYSNPLCYAHHLFTDSDKELVDLVLPNSITTIKDYTFYGCEGLKSVVIPNSITEIGYSTFYGCSELTSLTFNCKKIGSWFGSLTNITEIEIGSEVSEIEGWAFSNCERINTITSYIDQPFPVYYPFNEAVYDNALLYVPAHSLEQYETIEGWKNFKNIIPFNKGRTLTIKVVDSQDNDVTNAVDITWYDSDNNQIGGGKNLNGIEDGSTLYYSVLLNEDLGRVYREVDKYKVIAETDTILCQLNIIGHIMLEGRISATDIDKKTATVNVKQMLNGKYEQSYSTETDEQGTFKIEVYDDETEITISGDGYLDTKIRRDGFSGNGNVGTIPLNLISGFAITANLQLKKATAIGQAEEKSEWSAGLNNMDFILYNETKSSGISDFTIQNGNVIIKTGAEIGDEIRLTAKSKQDVFADASTVFTIAEGANNFSLVLTELGGLDVTCSSSSNSNTIGYLYNFNNTLIAKGGYVGETLSLRHLHNGTYTLVSMGGSTLLGNITSLSNLDEVGLHEGVDYVTTSVVVTDGVLTEATINDVPRMDDTRFYYTSSDTYFNANKESLTSGNYLTLSAHIDFKPEYSDKVDLVNLVIDIPEGCQIVENSVIANRQAVVYTIDGNRLMMTLNKEQWQGQIRFCVIPVLNQIYTLTAMATFVINGNISQPIGTAQFEAKGLSLTTPKYAANTNITINGTAKGHSEVSIYDNDVLIGKTSTKADGSWTAKCELYKPYSHSFHEIYAKITTENGMELTSETRQVEYDKAMPIPQKVTMTYYNGWYKENKTVEFNLLEGTTTPTSYPFYSGTDFTFLADFTRNDSTQIKNVNIKVLNSDGTVRTLPALYDGKLGKWVATTNYSSSSKLPQNVSVEFDNLINTNIYNEERELYAEATLRSLFESLNTDFSNFEYEISEELSNGYVFSFFNGGNGQKEFLKLTIENYDNIFIQYGAEDYLMVKNDSINLCVKDTISANIYSLLVWDNLNKKAYNLQYYDKKQSSNSRRRVVPLLLGLGYGIIYNSIDYYLNTEQVKYWYNVLFEKDELLKKQQKKMVDALYSKCSDGKYKIKDSYLMYLNTSLVEGWTLSAQLFLSEFERKVNEERRHQANRFFRSSVISGALSAVAAIGESFLPAVESVNWTSLTNCLKNIGKYAGVEAASQAGNEVVNRGLDHITNTKSIADWYVSESQKLTSEYIDVYKGIIDSYSSCKKDDKEKEDKPREEKPNNNTGSNENIPTDDFNGKGSTPEIDPSGYVYEAVLSNRLEGVTTTCYQKVQKEDMYGDIAEEAVVWNAADYSQQNPLKTDAMGFYRWDVPQGMWQVKYEKEGYETVYSEWLPVPPPQLDVNVGMTQSTPPTVKLMRGFESGITIEMSKYMRPTTLNTTNVTVTRNGMTVKGSIDILNSEKEPNGDSEYASKLKFIPESAFDTSDDVIVTVHKEIESYCGVNMLSDHVQKVIIEPEIKEIVADSVISVPYQGTKDIQVVVLPKSAAAGKTLRIQTSSSMIASLDAEDFTIDENGSATLTLNGELPGSAFLTFTIDDTDIMAQSKVKVLAINDMVSMPMASIRSGESVDAGTLLSLTCETEGATIYYTLDGSCPCDETKRIKYEAPIVIDSDVIVKAIAVKEDMDDSDIATFVYMINGTGIEKIESDIRIWPYITSSTIHIDMKDMKADNISIINMNGMTMYSVANVKGQIIIDLARYAEGMYIVNVKCKDGRLVRKIVKVGNL